MIVGVLSNIGVFFALAAIALICQRTLGQFPEIGSKFIACYGMVTVLDPFLILLVDVIRKSYNCSLLQECVKDLASAECRYVTWN